MSLFGLMRSGDGCEFDGVAELLELCDKVLATPFGLIASGEVVSAELVVDGVVGEDVPADDQQRVGDRDEGSLLTTSFADALETDGEVTVLGADRCPGGLDERRGEPWVAGTGRG